MQQPLGWKSKTQNKIEMKKALYLSAMLLGLSGALKAQTDFSISGLGRVVVTDNKLKGPILDGDLSTPNKGVSGYILFDMKPTLKVNNNTHANAILRVKSPFGAFFGDQVQFEFRQFQIMGKINKYVDYQIGDINVEMTPYTVYAFSEMPHEFEAEVFKIRRNIVNYENFVIGNAWRLQGVQGFANIPVSKGLKGVYVNAFVVRTNATNESTVPDRILAGAKVNLKQSDNFSIGGNYVGLQDITVKTSAYDYVNHVLTGDAKISADLDAVRLQLKGETGFSSFDYTRNADKVNVSYNDYFYDVNGNAVFNPLKLKLFAGYRNVGPQFSSPSAQTRRINVTSAPQLFPTVHNNTDPRAQVLYDRFTQENVYNRSINAVLYPFLPAYNLIFPYGDATPNRKGLTAGISSDTALKALTAEVRVDLFNEIIGEGVVETRKFTGIRGGAVLEIGKLLDIKRRISVNAGYRYEKSSRGGLAPVDFHTGLVDAGASIEVLKKFDLMGGVKLLNASGQEYLTQRDQFNMITAANPLDPFAVYNVDLSQKIYTVGARLRFGDLSFFTLNYNISDNKEKNDSANDYKINQFFFNYTLIIP